MSLPAVEVEEHPARKKKKKSVSFCSFEIRTKITVNVNYVT